MVTKNSLAYRPQEAAAAMGCSRDTIFKLLRTNVLKGFKIGQSRFISTTELHAFMLELEQIQE